MGVNMVADTESVHSAYATDDAPAEVPIQGGSMAAERVIQPLSDAYAAAEPAYAPASEPSPVDFGLPMPPPIPDFSQVNSGAPAFPAQGAPQQPPILGDILSPDAAPNSAYAPQVPFQSELSEAQPIVQSNDPGQFQIPPQQ